jgi:superfamily II DNA/RNA helicase
MAQYRIHSCSYCRILHTLLECNAYAEFGSCQTPQALIIAPTRELAIQIKVGQLSYIIRRLLGTGSQSYDF